jgi:hypothetical protein
MGIFDALVGAKPQPSVPDIAAALAAQVFEGSVTAARELQTEWNKTNPESAITSTTEFWEMVAEFQFFLLNLLDRQAFARIGAARRSALMDLVADLVLQRTVLSGSAAISGRPEQPPTNVELDELQRALRSSLYTNLNERARVYGACTSITAPPGAGAKNTLLWEFSKAFSSACGRENDVHFGLLATVAATGAVNGHEQQALLAQLK